jgi:hypothetical protein
MPMLIDCGTNGSWGLIWEAERQNDGPCFGHSGITKRSRGRLFRSPHVRPRPAAAHIKAHQMHIKCTSDPTEKRPWQNKKNPWVLGHGLAPPPPPPPYSNCQGDLCSRGMVATHRQQLEPARRPPRLRGYAPIRCVITRRNVLLILLLARARWVSPREGPLCPKCTPQVLGKHEPIP